MDYTFKKLLFIDSQAIMVICCSLPGTPLISLSSSAFLYLWILVHISFRIYTLCWWYFFFLIPLLPSCRNTTNNNNIQHSFHICHVPGTMLSAWIISVVVLEVCVVDTIINSTLYRRKQTQSITLPSRLPLPNAISQGNDLN